MDPDEVELDFEDHTGLPGETAADYWRQTCTDICNTGGTVMIIGGHETGKTTFAKQLVSHARSIGKVCGRIDADPAQSEVGPPTTVGLRLEPKDYTLMSHPELHLSFIGAISPVHYVPEHLASIKKLTSIATACDLVAIDMPGYVHGSNARRLHQLLFELLAPAHVVAICRGSDLDSILAPLRNRSTVSVHRLQVPAAVEPKPGSFRRQRLAMKLSNCFKDSHQHLFPIDTVTLAGTWLGGGAPVAPHLLRYLTTALADFTRVYYAEQYGKHLGIIVKSKLPEDCTALGIAIEQFNATETTVTLAPHLKNLVVSLESGTGKVLGLGRVTAVDFKRRIIGVSSPIKIASAVQAIKFGGVRIGDDGAQIGLLMPGDA